MARRLRIGNVHGFWGDNLEAAAEMLDLEPDLDFLTLDFLAEVSMSILALQRSRDPEAGWPREFVEIVRSLVPYWRRGGRCRLITNAGGLNPMGCARACLDVLQAAGCTDRTIAVVSGDDVLDLIRAENSGSDLLRNMDTGAAMAGVRDRLLTANAYLGARPIVEALARGADLVITGRVADPSLTVAACAHAFGWPWDAWDRLAGATVAGHLIECGTQVTGGISTDWLQIPDAGRTGFPIVEVDADGGCVVTKTRGTGGRVGQQTVKEQLVYEIGDPDQYLSPDVTLSLLSLQVEDQGGDRVRVSGARGRPAPPTYKVSATFQDGFRAQGQLTVYGSDAVAKARRAAQAVLDQLRASGVSLRECVVECIGAGACRPQGADPDIARQLTETVLRIAVADDTREAVERFARALMPLVTAGPPGTTGYAEGRPHAHPMFRFWPCLIERERVHPRVELLGTCEDKQHVAADVTYVAPGSAHIAAALPHVAAVLPHVAAGLAHVAAGRAHVAAGLAHVAAGLPTEPPARPQVSQVQERPRGGAFRHGAETCGDPGDRPSRLGDIAYARSGDKGIHANIGVIARRREDFARLCREVTVQRVASYLGLVEIGQVLRYELPNLGAINLVIRGILVNPLRVDAQGKALGQVLLEMPLEAAAERTYEGSGFRVGGSGCGSDWKVDSRALDHEEAD